MNDKFWHFGKLGDIIYCLPTIKEFGSASLNVSPDFKEIMPLLDRQPYIRSTGNVLDESMKDITLLVRYPRAYQIHLAQSHWLVAGGEKPLDLSHPWLSNIEPRFEAEIIVTKTPRWPSPMDWSPLIPYKKRALYIGIQKEWEEANLPIPFFQVRDLVEFASIIAGSKLYVSNQTFGFAVAEGLKVNRALAHCPHANNCVPQSSNGRIGISEEVIEQCLG